MERTSQHESIDQHAEAASDAIQGMLRACLDAPLNPYVRDYALAKLKVMVDEARDVMRNLPGGVGGSVSN